MIGACVSLVSISLATEVGIGLGFAAACSGKAWLARCLDCALVPIVVGSFVTLAPMELFRDRNRRLISIFEGIAILCACSVAMGAYAYGLSLTTAAPPSIRRRTCIQTIAFASNMITTHLPVSIIMLWDSEASHDTFFMDDPKWQLVSWIRLSSGALNILSYMIWVHRDSQQRARLSDKLSPSSYENAILNTYFSLAANADTVVLTAERDIIHFAATVRSADSNHV